MINITDNLNDKQKEAVLATEGYNRIVAGAGAGKTKVLANRYAHLVANLGVDSSHILCLTFTNKAANEMRTRIKSLIGDIHGSGLICTYHGFCYKLIKEESKSFFLTNHFTILDPDKQKSVLKEIYEKQGLELDYNTFQYITQEISGYKKFSAAKRTDNKPMATYIERMTTPGAREIVIEKDYPDREIIEDYIQKQIVLKALDFTDLILFALYILHTNDDIAEKWQLRLNYIMVDEYQDSAAEEEELLEILTKKHNNLMVVGDPDQNIYEWRGSNVNIFVDMEKVFNPLNTILLEQNYRSTPDILNAANSLIQENTNRLEKNLWTRNNAYLKPIHYHAQTDAEEMKYIITEINKLHDVDKVPYSDIAIIYRSGFISRQIEQVLSNNAIPYEIFGELEFFKRKVIKDAIAYLRIVVSDDDESLMRIINIPSRRFGKIKKDKLLKMHKQANAAAERTSIYEILKSARADTDFMKSDVFRLVDAIEEARSIMNHTPLNDLVKFIMDKTGYSEYIQRLGDVELYNDLLEFERLAANFDENYEEHFDLPSFLDQLALQNNFNEDKTISKVKLMTVHKSKGLEFPVVFMPSVSEGIFPSSKTLEIRKRPGLEEERRLCYVAVTRAEKKLYMTESAECGKYYSRFFDDIGEDNVTFIGYLPPAYEALRADYIRQIDIKYKLEDPYEIGTIITHEFFGQGKILELNKEENSYMIKFDNIAIPRAISMGYFAKDKK